MGQVSYEIYLWKPHVLLVAELLGIHYSANFIVAFVATLLISYLSLQSASCWVHKAKHRQANPSV